MERAGDYVKGLDTWWTVELGHMSRGHEDDGMDTARRMHPQERNFGREYVGYTLVEYCLDGLCSVASHGRTNVVVRAGILIQCPGGPVHD